MVRDAWRVQQHRRVHPCRSSHVCPRSVLCPCDSSRRIRICWPFFGDQPLNVVHLTDNLDVAYELLEVRNGPWGLKPIHRTGTTPTGTLDAVRAEAGIMLEKAFGKDGARKRVNVQKLRDATLELWKDGGEAKTAAEELLDSITA